MMAWVEWHFADFAEIRKKGQKFDCDTCPVKVQKLRKCHEDKWDHEGQPFPIRLLEGSPGYGFCPAKLFRDDQQFCTRMRDYYVAWKLGQMPSGYNIDSMFDVEVDLMFQLITTWEHCDKIEKFKMLSWVIGGKDGRSN